MADDHNEVSTKSLNYSISCMFYTVCNTNTAAAKGEEGSTDKNKREFLEHCQVSYKSIASEWNWAQNWNTSAMPFIKLNPWFMRNFEKTIIKGDPIHVFISGDPQVLYIIFVLLYIFYCYYYYYYLSLINKQYFIQIKLTINCTCIKCPCMWLVGSRLKLPVCY